MYHLFPLFTPIILSFSVKCPCFPWKILAGYLYACMHATVQECLHQSISRPTFFHAWPKNKLKLSRILLVITAPKTPFHANARTHVRVIDIWCCIQQAQYVIRSIGIGNVMLVFRHSYVVMWSNILWEIQNVYVCHMSVCPRDNAHDFTPLALACSISSSKTSLLFSFSLSVGVSGI